MKTSFFLMFLSVTDINVTVAAAGGFFGGEMASEREREKRERKKKPGVHCS
jgi:F0F1-type ATP synthase epsilon subunit